MLYDILSSSLSNILSFFLFRRGHMVIKTLLIILKIRKISARTCLFISNNNGILIKVNILCNVLLFPFCGCGCDGWQCCWGYRCYQSPAFRALLLDAPELYKIHDRSDELATFHTFTLNLVSWFPHTCMYYTHRNVFNTHRVLSHHTYKHTHSWNYFV